MSLLNRRTRGASRTVAVPSMKIRPAIRPLTVRGIVPRVKTPVAFYSNGGCGIIM